MLHERHVVVIGDSQGGQLSLSLLVEFRISVPRQECWLRKLS
jgi:acetyl esterase/lipase